MGVKEQRKRELKNRSTRRLHSRFRALSFSNNRSDKYPCESGGNGGSDEGCVAEERSQVFVDLSSV